ncbi:hypothetical protein BH24ACT15_BH24ACT15_11630 [soil metagenome]
MPAELWLPDTSVLFDIARSLLAERPELVGQDVAAKQALRRAEAGEIEIGIIDLVSAEVRHNRSSRRDSIAQDLRTGDNRRYGKRGERPDPRTPEERRDIVFGIIDRLIDIGRPIATEVDDVKRADLRYADRIPPAASKGGNPQDARIVEIALRVSRGRPPRSSVLVVNNPNDYEQDGRLHDAGRAPRGARADRWGLQEEFDDAGLVYRRHW